MELFLIGFILLALLATVVVFAACIVGARVDRNVLLASPPEPLRDGAPAFVRRMV